MKKENKTKIEYYTWADKTAGMLRKRGKEHVIHGMWTPSGYFHIGNARSELLTQSLVKKAAEDNGLTAEQNFFIDDFDDFDKIPSGIDVDKKKFAEFLGKPLRDVPSPVEGHDSWGEYFADDVVSVLDIFGIDANVISSYDAYKSGKYDEAILIVLNNARKIRDIWVKISGAEKPENWIPVMPVCEKCGRASTTIPAGWDGEILAYSCSKDRDYCKSCGHIGALKPGNGNVKLPWRIHWAATWYTFGTTYEPAGKDHFTKGGSVDTSQAILKKVFGKEPPLQLPGEFIQLDGEKISGSVGNVITMKDWLQVAEPELLRFMFISYQQNTAIDFDMESNKLFLLADRYDNAENAFFGKKSDDKRTNQMKREYELSQVLKPKKPGTDMDYAFATVVTQLIGNDVENALTLLRKTGHIKGKLNKENEERIVKRLWLAQNWVERFAPAEKRIRINEKPQVKLDVKQKNAVRMLVDILSVKRSQDELYSKFFDISKSVDISSNLFFKTVYQILISKDSGPRLAPFIIAIGQDRVRKILEKVL